MGVSDSEGHFMVPDVSWNYNFMVPEHSDLMTYKLVHGKPLEFLHPCHCFKTFKKTILCKRKEIKINYNIFDLGNILDSFFFF